MTGALALAVAVRGRMKLVLAVVEALLQSLMVAMVVQHLNWSIVALAA